MRGLKLIHHQWLLQVSRLGGTLIILLVLKHRHLHKREKHSTRSRSHGNDRPHIECIVVIIIVWGGIASRVGIEAGGGVPERLLNALVVHHTKSDLLEGVPRAVDTATTLQHQLWQRATTTSNDINS